MPLATACVSGAVSEVPAGSWGSSGHFTVTEDTVTNPSPVAPADVTVFRPTGQVGVPVLFFSHAFGATDPASYRDLFTMLASNGIAVVHVPYPLVPPGENDNADRYACLWSGFQAAVAAQGATFDLTRVGFAGHSFGGGATPELGRRGFVEQGWGTNGRFLFVMAPWYSWGSGYDTLPSNTKVVVQVYADDDTNDHQIAVDDIWSKLPATVEKSWQLIRTDVCGCGLNATHTAPMTRNTFLNNPQNVLNGLDTWGVFRRLHALARYAWQQDATARDVALGRDGAMGTFLGCQRPVRPLEQSSTTPLVSACRPSTFAASARCSNADPNVACP
jgi:hypothetical protein